MLGKLRRQIRQDRQEAAQPPGPGLDPPPLLEPGSAADSPADPDMANPLIIQAETVESPRPEGAEPNLWVQAELARLQPLHPRLHATLLSLNPDQIQAVLSPDKALLLRAQVGSGKTSVLVYRILVLLILHEVPLRCMAVLTFTRKAAEEIRHRIIAFAPDPSPSWADFWLFGTFHSVARTLLQRALPIEKIGLTKEFTVLDESGRHALWQQVIADHGLRVLYPNRLANRMQQWQTKLRQQEEIARNGAAMPLAAGATKPLDDDMPTLYSLSATAKITRNTADFDDLIDFCAQLLPLPEPPRHILVDELQDCEPRELALLQGLRGPPGPLQSHLFAVGDPYQTIYTWRGGSPALFAQIREAFGCTELTLPLNYRSSGAILACARAVLGLQPDVGPGRHNGLMATRGPGQPVVIRRHHDAVAEALYLRDQLLHLHASGVPWSRMAVLARMRRQLSLAAEQLRLAGIAVREGHRQTLAERPAAAWLLAVLTLLHEPEDLARARPVITHRQFGFASARHWPRSKFGAFLAKRRLTGLAGLAAWWLSGDQAEAKRAGLLLQRLIDWWAAAPAHREDFAAWSEAFLPLADYLMPTSAEFPKQLQDARLVLRAVEAAFAQSTDAVGILLQALLDDIALHGLAALSDAADPQAETVQLLTLHAAKGLEFQHVFILTCNQGALPLHSTQGQPAAEAEERRLLFVGLTRARDSVEVGWLARPGSLQIQPSPSSYLMAIPAGYAQWVDVPTARLEPATAGPGAGPHVEALAQAEGQEPRVIEGFAIGSSVRHPRYGVGTVSSADAELIVCQFAKFGERSFPAALCPLAPVVQVNSP